MFEQWLVKHDQILRRTARKYGGKFWEDDLYQNLLLVCLKASRRYGDEFERMAPTCVRNAVTDHLRFLKRNTWVDLSEDVSSPETPLYDWESLFEVGHRTGNLTAVRLMRSVVNPDRNQLQRERETGGFNWNIVYQTVGKPRRQAREAFAQLKKSVIQEQGDSYSFYLEGA